MSDTITESIIDSLKNAFDITVSNSKRGPGNGAPSEIPHADEVERGEIEISTDSMAYMMNSTNNSNGQRDVLASYMAAQTVGEYRDGILKGLRSIKGLYVIAPIIEVMCDDVMKPDKQTGEIITLSSTNPKFQKELREWKERVNLEESIQDVCPDLIHYGEYALSVKTEPSRGVTELNDDVDVENIFPQYKGGKIDSFLKRKTVKPVKYSQSEVADRFEKVDRDDLMYFVRAGRKIRVRTVNKTQGVEKKLPSQIRIGRSIFPQTLIPVIKSLQTLEAVLPVLRLLQLDRRNIVGVRLAGITKPEKMMKAVKEYERIINSAGPSGEFNFNGDINVSDLVAALSYVRVIPLMGDKGSVEISEIPTPDIGRLDDFEYLKKIIYDGSSVPIGYVLGGQDKSTETLKGYVRYLKKVGTIQKAIADAVKYLCVQHLNGVGMNAVPSDIQVAFANTVSIEAVDEMEFLDVLTNLLRGYLQFAKDLDDNLTPLGGQVEWNEVAAFIHDRLGIFVGAEKMLSSFADPKVRETLLKSDASVQEEEY